MPTRTRPTIVERLADKKKRRIIKQIEEARKGIRFSKEDAVEGMAPDPDKAIRADRFRIKAGKKGVFLSEQHALNWLERQRKMAGQTQMRRDLGGKLPRGPATLLPGSRPIPPISGVATTPPKSKLRKIAEKLFGFGGRGMGRAMAVAEPVKAMTDVTLEQEHRRRLRGLQNLTRQKFKEM